MLTWSTSATTTTKPNAFRSTQTKVAEEFLQTWDNAVYEGKTIGDTDLDKEAELWRQKFAHLRIIGVNCGPSGHKVTIPSTQKAIQSKSAITWREKNRELSLPRIDKFQKK
ncbi:unnamed protein product [Caenorhabditis sp. 36 PRJEB53466]|nr:unnamed protein product [Caenorhabditis sp. 36 PRJEB53466]